MRIIGIDPGTRRLGWCVFENGQYLDSGVIAAAGKTSGERLEKIAGKLRSLFEAHRPQECAIEAAFVGQFAKAALALGEARGVVMALAWEGGAKCASYSPTEIKMAIGSGRAGKMAVKEMSAAITGSGPFEDDEGDAVAVAICHCARMQWRSRICEDVAKVAEYLR